MTISSNPWGELKGGERTNVQDVVVEATTSNQLRWVLAVPSQTAIDLTVLGFQETVKAGGDLG